ncbi:MAG: FAD-dependent oxidoreductase [Candidatus Cloacimonadales bacterium]
MAKKIVIIGAVACGTKAASRLRRLDSQVEIVLVDQAKIISYGACGLPYYLADQIPKIEKLYYSRQGVRDAEYFRKIKKIDKVYTETKALKIDRQKQTVLLQDLLSGKEFSESYDKLLLATGANAIRPPLDNIEAENIFNLKTPADGVAIKKLLQAGKVKKPAIVGAGLIGIEVAEALRSYQLPVQLIDMADTILPNLFDPEMATDIADKLSGNSVQLFLNAQVEKFLTDEHNKVRGLQLADQEIATDLVILAVGFAPNTILAQEAGLKLAKNKALLVDEYFRTSDPNIYAGGDCIINRSRVTQQLVYTPLGDLANIQGRIIADNIITDNSISYRGVIQNAVTKFEDLKMGAAGISESQARKMGYTVQSAIVKAPDKAGYYPDDKRLKLKMVAEQGSGKILGVQVTGSGNVSKALNTISTLLSYEGTLHDLSQADLAYSPAFSPALDILIVAANVLGNKI